MIFPKVIFTNSNQIDSVDKLQGQILVCKDTEKVFIDIKNGQRIGITDKAIQAAVNSAGKNAIKSLSIEDNILTYITGDGQTKHYNIEDKDTTYDPATTTTDGLMSAADKNKLNGIATGANKYSLPLASSTTRGGVRIGYTANGKNYPVQLSNEQMYVNVPWTDTNTTYGNMTAATASVAGKAGLVPAPAAGSQGKYLRGDGTWQTPPDTNTVYTHPTTSGNKHIPAGGSNGQILRWSADGTAVWGNDNNTTYGNMTAATASAAGKAGLVPAPAAGKQTSFLRGDGQWVIPTNTTYNVATASANGLLSAHDKTWIDGKFRRYVYGSDTNDTTHNGYYKIASVNTTSTYTSHILKLRIFSDNFTNFAIAPISELEIVFRTNAANSTPTIYVYTNVNGANSALWNYLYIKYNNTNTSNWTFTLYFNKTAAWQKIVVDVLGEGKRSSTASSSNYQSVYTMDNSNTFVASITETGFNVAKLSIALAGHTVGNSSVPIYLNKGIPTAVTGLTTNRTTSTFLAGNQGTCIINSTAGAGAYTMLAKMNSTNGYFTEGVYQTKYLLQYTAKTTVDANTNSVTKAVTLLDEAGNSQFPGTITALAFAGNASTADKLKTARSIRVNLASTSAINFDGSANITPGVTGVLPIANGGTGNSTGKAATATKLATARTINGTAFDGSKNVNIDPYVEELSATGTWKIDDFNLIKQAVNGVIPKHKSYVCMTASYDYSTHGTTPEEESWAFRLDVDLIFNNGTKYVIRQDWWQEDMYHYIRYYDTWNNNGWTEWESQFIVSQTIPSITTSATTMGLHRMAAGTANATTSNCPVGCWYGKY